MALLSSKLKGLDIFILCWERLFFYLQVKHMLKILVRVGRELISMVVNDKNN